MRWFFARTNQSLNQDWLIDMVKKLMAHLPITPLRGSDLPTSFVPRTRNWKKASEAIKEYVEEQEVHHRKALGLDGLVEMAKGEVAMMPAHQQMKAPAHQQMKDVA